MRGCMIKTTSLTKKIQQNEKYRGDMRGCMIKNNKPKNEIEQSFSFLHQ